MTIFNAKRVDIWWTGLNDNSADLSALLPLLSEDELARTAQFRFEADRHRFVIARGTLRALLGCYLHRTGDNISFTYGPHGKPGLPALSCTPQPLFFNVSHTTEAVAYAVTAVGPVGIDLEIIRTEFPFEEVSKLICSERERTELMRCPAATRPALFFRYWTRKEACCKATGSGIGGDLTLIDTTDLPHTPTWFPSPQNGIQLRDLEIAPGHAAALALQTDQTEVSVRLRRLPAVLSPREC